jgi:hypothetical protein
MGTTGPHVLAPPFGLPDPQEERLLRYLTDEDWGLALTLLRDVVDAQTTDGKLLVLLAHCRYRDALETMVDQRMAACQEALALLERAHQHGVEVASVFAFREEVEATLAQETAHELSVLAKLPAEGESLAAVPLELLEEGGYLVWDSQPLRAAHLFVEASKRMREAPGVANADTQALFFRVQAGLCFARAGSPHARAFLDEALSVDLKTKGLETFRAALESAAVALLKQLTGADFRKAWAVARERGQALGLPFPSVWPNQEELLTRCIALGEHAHALELVGLIEESRQELPRALAEVLRAVRSGRAGAA